MPEQFQRCKDNGLIITADYRIVIIALKCHWRAGGENLWIKSVSIAWLWKVKLNECAQYHFSEVVKHTLLSCVEWWYSGGLFVENSDLRNRFLWEVNYFLTVVEGEWDFVEIITCRKEAVCWELQFNFTYQGMFGSKVNLQGWKTSTPVGKTQFT